MATELKVGDVVGLIGQTQVGEIVSLEGAYTGSVNVKWYPDQYGGFREGNPAPDRVRIMPIPPMDIARIVEWLNGE